MSLPRRDLRSILLAGSMLAAVSATMLPVGASQAQETAPAAPPPAEPAEPAEGPSIVVTGSRIARSGFDSPTPLAVVDQEAIKLAGNVNIERTLVQLPQAVGSQFGNAFSNTVPGGFADVNLRGFGAQRNLVLVNGRRFAIYGPEQVVDLNTIPTSLVARTEIVTGGSSAVYGSDAIAGVVNFIIRDDWEGVEGRGQLNLDHPTGTPVVNLDLTVGGNFADGRGNLVVSGNYLDRGSITRGERGSFAFDSLNDGCTVAGSGSASSAGTPFTPPPGQTCRAAGGEPGFLRGGSGDIPNGRFSGIPAFGGANAALNAAYAAAGLNALGSRGFTFDDTGTAARPALTPQDDFNLGPDNYLRQPQRRWMINSFGHYDFADSITGYMELHYSNNEVAAQLAPTNVGSPTLFDVGNPYLTPQLQKVLRQLDLAERGPVAVPSGTASRTTTPGDGLAVVTAGRRYVEVGPRQATERRNVFRVALGVRGDLGSLGENALTDLRYDAYYTYSRSEGTLLLQNAISRSRLQASLLAQGGAAPVCNIFGQNVTEQCRAAIAISASNSTVATQQVAQASLTGTAFELPAGPLGFSLGVEWRKTSTRFVPDNFLASGDVAGFNPGLPTEGSVGVKEVFGEVRVPLLRDQPFFDNLTANGAFRYSSYDLDGVGGVWTYLGGLEWQPVRDVLLRGQYQRAIRAPNVGELFGGRNRVVGAATDPCSSRGNGSEQTDAVRQLCIATGVPADLVFGAGVQPNNIFPADFGGNPNLQEEVSDTWTAGIVLTPRFAPGLSLSMDYFDITLDGAIAALGGSAQNALNLCYLVIQDAGSEFCQAVRRNPQTGEINDPYALQVLNANTGRLQTSGIDFAARYDLDLPFGFPMLGETSRLDLAADFSWLNAFDTTPVAALPDIVNECAGSFGPACGQPLPRWRGLTRATWTVGDVALNLRYRYIGPVVTDRYVVPLRQGSATTPALENIAYPRLPAQGYVDLSFNWNPEERFELYGGVNNLFNNNPPITTQGPNSNTYTATYDILGVEFFLGAAVRF